MRIRAIKPEFWRSDDITALSREFRLLFIGLWSYVDDNGVGVDDYRQIAADLFALEDDQKEVREYVREGLATLSRALLVIRYEVEGKSYLFIRSWDKHQRIDRPSKPRYPRPPADLPPPTSGNPSDTDHVERLSRHPLDGLDAGTGEQGNRGTGEKALRPPASNAPTDRARQRGGGERVTPAELNRTAHRPHGHTLVTAWAAKNPGLTAPRRRELTKAVDELLAQGANPDLLPATLDEAHRPNWRHPVKALPIVYEQIRRGAHPDAGPDGRHLRAVPDRPVAELADDEIDVEEILGPVGDWAPPPCPDYEQMTGDQYRAWCRQKVAERDAARIVEARRLLEQREIRRLLVARGVDPNTPEAHEVWRQILAERRGATG